MLDNILPIAISILLALGMIAGAFGALLGLGGSVILVPILTLLGIPVGRAAAIGLICVITTSCSASAVYLREGWTDIRVGLPLQLSTVFGALTGAWVAPYLPADLFKFIFGAFLVYAAVLLWRRSLVATEAATDVAHEETPGDGSLQDYTVQNRGLGAAVCYAAGNVSGLLGIGGGPIQVPLMHVTMGLPMKAATATSSFMMGMTATAGALLYYARGDLLVAIAAPLALGVFLGAQAGSRIARHLHSRTLQRLLIIVLVTLAAGLLLDALDISFFVSEGP